MLLACLRIFALGPLRLRELAPSGVHCRAAPPRAPAAWRAAHMAWPGAARGYRGHEAAAAGAEAATGHRRVSGVAPFRLPRL